MAVSTVVGIAFGTSFFHRQLTEPSRQSDTQPVDLIPPDPPSDETVSPPPGTPDTSKEDQAVQAVSFSMHDADESIGMGWGCRSKAECQRAIKSLTQAIRAKPNSSNAYCKRAWIYYSMGEFHKAVKDAGKSIRFNPKNADAYQVRSFSYESLGLDSKMSADDVTYTKLVTEPH